MTQEPITTLYAVGPAGALAVVGTSTSALRAVTRQMIDSEEVAQTAMRTVSANISANFSIRVQTPMNSKVWRLLYPPAKRLADLRLQAKRKGRPGWKRIA